ncbi:hypothetical protein OEZ85_012420 [Tetradesmus obliquus]|uniref:DUF4336 domain-containing protein n=1 Tax=Tetradesmus obliquus TaxID=3088 RepID=A0ABY8TTP0_TETOB|nr:hypothetical protein OEZ85_012420 [Tetradesmus obliquus]
MQRFSSSSSSSSSMHMLHAPAAPHAAAVRSSRRRVLPVQCKVTTKQQQAATAKGRSTVSSKTQRGSTVSGTKTVRGREQQAALQQQQQQQQQSKKRGSRFYFNITGFPFPLGPFFERKTVRNEVVKGQVWTFEQTQAFFFDVFTPVRMTVIKLKSGGLWVHAPVAPTQECINLLKELDAPVEYIVLPTFAYEHKVFVAPFSRRFPKAKVYVAPGQWSLPLNLPNEWLGIFPAGELADGDTNTPWADEIEQKVLLPPQIAGLSKVVKFTEVSFFHKPSRSLLVTDAVVYVDVDPPACIPDEALRSQAQDGWLQRYLAGGRSRQEISEVARSERVEDSREARRTAWARMSLLVLYFNPSDLLTPQASFDAISRRLLVGPVVRTLVYDKIPNTVCDWVDSMCADWRFQRIIPAHFSAPVKAGPAEFREAFRFVYDQVGRTPGGSSSSRAGSSSSSGSNPFSSLFGFLGGSSQSKAAVKGTSRREGDGFPEADVKVLKGLNQLLIKYRVVFTDAEERAGIGSSSSGSKRR